MIDYGSVVPERENLPYYVIPMQWLNRWQKYTGCYKFDEEEESDRVLKTKDLAKLILGPYPGEINTERDLKNLMVDTRHKVFISDENYFGSNYIKNGKKED